MGPSFLFVAGSGEQKGYWFSWLSTDSIRFPGVTSFLWPEVIGFVLFFNSSPIILIPALTLNVWPSIWIFWGYFSILYVFLTRITLINFKHIIFSFKTITFKSSLSHGVNSMCKISIMPVIDEKFCFLPQGPWEKWGRFRYQGSLTKRTKPTEIHVHL